MTRACAIAALLLAALPAAASAALDFQPCTGDGAGIGCARVTVPLDRTGAVPGTIDVAVYRAPATAQPPRGVLLAFPGGPGDSGFTYFRRRLRTFDAIRRTHDLVFVDPRGTGASNALQCPDAASCARELGAGSRLYTSRDVADDAEAVRAALGVEQVALYGISYGTWFAQTYARRHPSRVSALLLDAVVSQAAQDNPFPLGPFASLPRALRTICDRGACRGISADPFRDLGAITRAALRGRLRGTVVGENGRRVRERLDAASAASAIANLDVNPPLRTELPAALAAARRGDAAPLLRLTEAGLLPLPDDATKFSTGANVATLCEEAALPWERTAPLDGRLERAQRRIEQIPESAFAPAGRGLALLASIAPLCQAWPSAPEDPLVRGPLPAVPSLVLAGDADVRTPARDGAEVARSIPGARTLLVANSGHGALVEEPTGCAARIAAAFLDGAAGPPVCPRVRLLPRPAFPRSLARVPARAVRGTDPSRRRVIAAAVMTATDALNQAAMRHDAQRARVVDLRFGGLRGGTVRGVLGNVALRRAVYVPGVIVSGDATASGRHELTVRGALGGALRVEGRRVTGTLGGRRVRATLDLAPLGAGGVRVESVL